MAHTLFPSHTHSSLLQGPNFRGFQQVPEGLHFLYHSTGMGNRQGFFIQTLKGQVLALSWDKVNEEILARHTLPSGALEALYSETFSGRLDNQLGPYPYNQLHLWNNVSCMISTRVLERADCLPGTMIYPGDGEERPVNQELVPHFTGIARYVICLAYFYLLDTINSVS